MGEYIVNQEPFLIFARWSAGGGSDINVMDSDGRTAWLRVIVGGTFSEIRDFYAAVSGVLEFNVSASDNMGQGALHLAVGRNDALEVIPFLLELEGICATSVDGFGNTGLHRAASFGYLAAVRALCEYSSEVCDSLINLGGGDGGKTPLGFASNFTVGHAKDREKMEVVVYLIGQGADTTCLSGQLANLSFRVLLSEVLDSMDRLVSADEVGGGFFDRIDAFAKERGIEVVGRVL